MIERLQRESRSKVFQSHPLYFIVTSFKLLYDTMTMCKLFAVVIYALVYIKKIKKTRKHIKIFKYNSKQFSSFDFLE